MKTTRNSNLLGTLVFAALLTSSPVALAQQGAQSNAVDDGWVPVKHLTFTDDEIEGMHLDPDGQRIESVLRATHDSLIEIRRGFEAEIVKSTEDM